MKFDLKDLLREVHAEDRPVAVKSNQRLTQREIRELVIRRRALKKKAQRT